MASLGFRPFGLVKRILTPRVGTIVLVVLLVTIAGGSLCWRYLEAVPQLSVYRMFRAAAAGDYEAFTKYFDINLVLGTLVENLEDTWSGEVSGEDLVAAAKPVFEARLSAEVEEGIFQEGYGLSNVIEAFTKVKVRREGEIADVTVVNSQGGSLTFKMSRRGDVWRVSEMALDFDACLESALSSLLGGGEEEEEEIVSLPTRVEGLAAIKVESAWADWDDDGVEDGAKVLVTYLDGEGNNISTEENVTMPISADVKIVTLVWGGEVAGYERGREVYSAKISSDEFVTDWLSPWFKIMKDQINVDLENDYRYGLLEVTIHTPGQGSFSGANESFRLF